MHAPMGHMRAAIQSALNGTAREPTLSQIAFFPTRHGTHQVIVSVQNALYLILSLCNQPRPLLFHLLLRYYYGFAQTISSTPAFIIKRDPLRVLGGISGSRAHTEMCKSIGLALSVGGACRPRGDLLKSWTVWRDFWTSRYPR